MLNTYEQFIERVDSLGFMAMSGGFLDGFPTLERETARDQWHTGDPETDPWQWKDRAAAEHNLAFGCLLGGHKGFISRDMYPLFFAACRPQADIHERYEDGTVSQTLLQAYKLFERGGILSTADIRNRMGVTKKQGASRLDSAIAQLQRQFLITVCGNQRKVSQDGREYGWPANTYCLAERWARDWLDAPMEDQDEARTRILDHCAAWNLDFNMEQLEKRLFGWR